MRDRITREATREGWVIIGSLFGSVALVSTVTAVVFSIFGI